MTVLATQTNYRSLSLKDLLEARDIYHWHLMNKANVVGTAVGLYLIRKDDPWPAHRSAVDRGRPGGAKTERTFENSEVRPYSWPCVLVLVSDWLDPVEFGGEGIDPDYMLPRALHLPDGHSVPVCVVAVKPGAASDEGVADVKWPESYIGGGFPVVEEVQGVERSASVGCLVTDAHKIYAVTNRHVAGDPGSIVSARVRGNLLEVGKASQLQLSRLPFTDVFPEFPGRRTFLTLDIGLIEVDRSDDWSSSPFGLEGKVGDVADLNELNLGVQLIDQEVCAFGAESGALTGKIKALFYRHKTMAGYDYVSEFLIAPGGGHSQTRPGDSGTVWYLRVPAPHTSAPTLRPMAVEWGGQTLLGAVGDRYNFALATGLSTVCRLHVDLVTSHNVGATPYWGQTGHYSIATVAVGRVRSAELARFLKANLERISFKPDELTPEAIKEKLSNGEFVELADVPDLVWKKTPDKVPGGRDYAQNAGPEHPNHYADADEPDASGSTLRSLTLSDPSHMDVGFWLNWYVANGHTDSRSQGLLPFRVWQIFDEMVRSLRAGQAARFLCAAGVISHYVGDTCQPLHGSYRSDGYKDPNDPKAKKWRGKGVHSTYEDKMVDRHSAELLAAIDPAANQFGGSLPDIHGGRDAAFAIVKLMDEVAAILPPTALCDEYIRLGGGASAAVVDGLWKAFGNQTAQVMGAGAVYLAAIWEAAYAVAGGGLRPSDGAIDEAELAATYQDAAFVPSLTLEKIGTVLSAAPSDKGKTPAAAVAAQRPRTKGGRAAARKK